jgi:hypothetical protein
MLAEVVTRRQSLGWHAVAERRHAEVVVGLYSGFSMLTLAREHATRPLSISQPSDDASFASQRG